MEHPFDRLRSFIGTVRVVKDDVISDGPICLYEGRDYRVADRHIVSAIKSVRRGKVLLGFKGPFDETEYTDVIIWEDPPRLRFEE